MNQLKTGALLSYLTIFLTNVIGIVLTPFIIRTLGDSEYGLYTLLGSVVAYISVMDLGLNNTIVRYVSKFKAEKSKVDEENFLAVIMIIYAVISAVIFFIGVVLYFNFNNIFSESLTIDELGKGEIMFIILIFNLMITLPGGAFTAICSAYEKFIFPKLLTIIRYVLRSVFVVVLLMNSPSALVLVIIETIMSILFIGITIYYVFFKLDVRMKLYKFEWRSVREIFSYSIWILIYSLIIQLQWNFGQIILGITVNTTTVAIFGVAVMLVGYFMAFAGAINSMLLPKATQMSVANNSGEQYTDAVIKVGRINIFILFGILLIFFLVGKSFIVLWVGKTYEESWLSAFIMMSAMLLPLVQSFGNSILEAKGKNKFKSIISLISISLACAFGYYFSKDYGVVGFVYPLCISIVLNSLIMNWYFSKIFNFKPLKFFYKTFLTPLLIVICISLISLYFISKFGINSWLDLGIVVLIISSIYVISFYTIVLSEEERKVFKGAILKR